MTVFQPRAYLKEGCPFSCKFLLFMAEAGLLDEIDVIRCKADDPQFEALKARIAQGLGKKPTFPVVELEAGRFLADSDALIKHFSKQCGLEPVALPALEFYEQTILPQVVRLHKMEGQH